MTEKQRETLKRLAGEAASLADAIRGLEAVPGEIWVSANGVAAELEELEAEVWKESLAKNGEQPYQLWVSEQRIILVRLWPTGTLEVAVRETPEHTWGPPLVLPAEKIGEPT